MNSYDAGGRCACANTIGTVERTRMARLMTMLLTSTTIAAMPISPMAHEVVVNNSLKEETAPSTGVETAQTESVQNNPENQGIVTLAPITIDAKADVITGGVQIEAEDLDRINPRTMRDVFRQEPGVTVSSPLGISQQIHVNGVEDTNLAVDIDGARQANKTYHHIGTTVMDPGMLKAVKVETGVAPADAGPNALAGTISLETKDGRDFVSPGETFGGFAKLSFDSNTEGYTKELNVSSQVGNFDLMAYGSSSDGHGYEDGDGENLVGSDPAAENMLFKIGFSANNGYRAKLAANYFSDVSIRPPRPDFGFTGGQLAPTEYRRQNYTLSFGDQTPSDMWDPKLSLAYTRTKLDMVTTLDAFSATAAIRADIQTVNGKASNTFTTDYGKITTGFDAFHDVGKGGRNGFNETERALNSGAFVQARTSWTDEFRTSLGSRYDFSRLEGHGDATQTANGASANANIEYDLTEEWMGYAGASTVFGGYQLGEIGLFNSVNNYDGMEPSRATNYKVGAVYEIGKFVVDGNFYMTRINNALLLDESDRADNVTLDARGFNVSAKYTYGDGFIRAGLSTNNLRVNGVYRENRSADYLGTDTGEALNLEVSHFFPEYGLRIGTTNEAVLPDDSQLGITGSQLDGYVVSNLHAEWMPEQLAGLNLRFDVLNLFDRTYADRANVSIVESSGTTGVTTPFNEPGRTFLLTAKYDF